MLIYVQTTELTRLQMGEDPKDVRLVASTIAEIENLAPYLLECKAKGSNVNVGSLGAFSDISC